MSQNIKNNLFRFVTLRSPQLIDEKENHPGFVYHPEGPNRFLSAVDNQQESDKKALLEQDKEFTRRANASVVMPKALFSNVMVSTPIARTCSP